MVNHALAILVIADREVATVLHTQALHASYDYMYHVMHVHDAVQSFVLTVLLKVVWLESFVFLKVESQ